MSRIPTESRDLKLEIDIKSLQLNNNDATNTFDDNASTLYAPSSIFDDNASTLYALSVLHDDDDAAPLVEDNRKQTKSLSSVQDLQHLLVVVIGCKPKTINGKQVVCNIFSIRRKLRRNQADLIRDNYVELYQIEKSYQDMLKLDEYNLDKAKLKLMNKKLFASYAPIKSDKRKCELELYFRIFLINLASSSKVEVHPAIYDFFNTAIVDNTPQKSPKGVKYFKSGYLVKKEGSELFGTWKPKYFVLQDSILASEGLVINLNDALIGSQNDKDLHTTDYRHGLVINEIQKNRFVRHSFCAFDDSEREAWVDALISGSRSVEKADKSNEERFDKSQCKQQQQ